MSGASVSGGLAVLVRILRIADYHAHAMLLALRRKGSCPILEVDECRHLLRCPALADGERIRSEVFAICTTLGMWRRAEAMSMMRPLLPALPVRVMYVRHPAFWSADPVEVTLRQLCRVEVGQGKVFVGDLPDALIIAAPSECGATALLAEARRAWGGLAATLPTMVLTKAAVPPGVTASAEWLHCPILLDDFYEFLLRVDERRRCLRRVCPPCLPRDRAPSGNTGRSVRRRADGGGGAPIGVLKKESGLFTWSSARAHRAPAMRLGRAGDTREGRHQNTF